MACDVEGKRPLTASPTDMDVDMVRPLPNDVVLSADGNTPDMFGEEEKADPHSTEDVAMNVDEEGEEEVALDSIIDPSPVDFQRSPEPNLFDFVQDQPGYQGYGMVEGSDDLRVDDGDMEVVTMSDLDNV
jgi:hypothetical protein